MKVALTIAGSDSGGGAGIQADLKTFAAFKVYGTSVITSVTAQNTVGVLGIHDMPAEFVGAQMDAVLTDIAVDACKTGMLSNADIIKVVAERLEKYNMEKYVLDPVMVAKSGDALLQQDAVSSLIRFLIPRSHVITPNMDEASLITGMSIQTVDDMKDAALKIKEMGARAVVVKGGHLKGDAVDVFCGKDIELLSSERIDTRNTHGTGCTFSSAIAAGLARGDDSLTAVKRAKQYITDAIRYSFPIGEGHGPTNHFAVLYREAEKFSIVNQLREGFNLAKSSEIADVIPEVQSNLVMALSDADSVEDVAGFPGRIVRYKETVETVGCPEFGASSHMARVVLAVMTYDPTIRSAMNIRYGDDVVEAAERAGYTLGKFSREDEPQQIREKEGSTLDWGTITAIQELGKPPDIIYDLGGISREAMMRVLGKNPLDVVQKVIKISQGL
ncbi:MAG: bifunctional hydroxymethylpyrimidine kinase/phosphomethylpyrimidine kinase [Theionarchaea archaeon]|nr:bifunctional hydroxymethylpyrimidine kinase/phosphomethylpyrimidine kinase [Theionarchaea archaeon]MBU7037338.1 bifunctional hydroxymethylpyrimidine kinase/phosphomethylpyrimidine kinase [Theionarchaea archaeon]